MYLVCILFGMLSLHPFTFLMFFMSCKMLDRAWKRVGHGREREVEDGRRGVRRGETGKVSTYLDDCDRVSY